MAKNRSCPQFVHSIVCVLLLVSGGALLGYGIYRRAANKDGPFALDYDAAADSDLDDIWSFVFKFNTAAIIAGAFLLLSGIVALIALSRKLVGKLFRVVFFFMALVILAVLVALAVGAFYLLAKGDDLDGFVTDAWEATVKTSPNEICTIEKDYKCRGLKSGDCTDCPTGVGAGCTSENQRRCAPCSGSAEYVSNGCWNEFHSRFRVYYIVVGAVSSALAILALIDIFVLCAL